MDNIWAVWIGAFVTLAVFSYLIKDNCIYRIVQHAALGVAVGIALIVAWQQVLKPRWWDPIYAAFSRQGDMIGALWLLALIPGSLWYFQLSKKYFWASTFISGLFIGTAAGLAFKDQMLRIMPQIADSIKLLNPFAGPEGFTWAKFFISLNGLIVLAGMLTTLLYFFFSIKSEGNRLTEKAMRVGRIMIMICL